MVEQYVHMCADKLHSMRKNLKLSQNEVAEKVGISPTMYCRIEKGERKITYDLLEKLSIVLDANFKELLSLALADKMSNCTYNYDREIVDMAIKKCLPIINH